jgi:myo-inositol-1(or 4)-monophosphatase
VPIVASADEAGWETRQTGSAALECALVSAGLLEVARFAAPNVWDVAGGIALIRAGGGIVRMRDGGDWMPMNSFIRDNRNSDLRHWRHPLVVGRRQAVERMCAA